MPTTKLMEGRLQAPVTRTRPRDSRRQKVYAAENSIEHGRTFASLEEVQEFIYSVTNARWFRSRWGLIGVPVMSHSSGGSTGRYRGRINLARCHWNERTALHELAHVLISSPKVAAHGPEWVACYLVLVKHVMGEDYYRKLRAALIQRKVPVQKGAKAVPKPGTVQLETKAARVARIRAHENRPVTLREREVAADILRRAATQGLFGPAGRKPREHALATARLLKGAS